MTGTVSPPVRHARLDYSPQLDGLRAVAVIAVFLYHAEVPPFDEGGYIGVDVFFVLSGFLITTLLLREQADHGRIALRTFYVRRVRRLAPAAVTVSLAVATTFALATWPTLRRDTILGCLASLAQLAAWPRAFDVNQLGWMGHMWSLSVEEHFYLVWPALMALAAWRWPERISTILGLVAVVGIAYGNVAPDLLGWSVTRTYNGPDTRASDILVGCLLAVVLHRWPDVGRRGRAGHLGAVLGIAALAVWTMAVGSRGPLYTNWNILVVVAAAALILHLFRCPLSPLSRVLALPVLVWIGLRSYGIYLIHNPVIGLLEPITGRATAIPAAIMTAGLAALMYAYVETPIRRDGVRALVTRRTAGDGVRVSGGRRG